MSNRFPMPMAYGWYVVAYSDELAVGESKPLHYFGEDMVIYRGESGQVHVLDAYCPHLGAHLGYGINEESGRGGRIVDDTIVCPFHAWRFNGNGEVVEIPYARAIPPKVAGKQCLKAWPVTEANQCVWVWYHPDNAAPMWEVVVHDETASDDWAPLDRYEWIIRTHTQEMAENAADPAHFQYVHGTLSVPEWETEYTGHEAHGIQRVDMKTPRGDVKGAIYTNSIGPGQGYVRFTGIAETFQMGLVTPIDDETVHVRFAFTQPKVDGEVKTGGVNAAIVRDIVKQLDEDKPIWEHKVFRPQPTLCDGDGPIAKFRKWYGQFYAERARIAESA